MKLTPQDLDRMHSKTLDRLGILGSGSLAPITGTESRFVNGARGTGRYWPSHKGRHGSPRTLDVIEGNAWE